jgi:acyl-CoA synthetase (AMP-forming)/AMP-acid ligase II
MAGTVRDLITKQAAERPAAVYALASDASQTLHFGELQQDCLHLQAAWERLGLQPGDTVSLVLPNGLQTLRVLLGGLHAGLVVNPVNLLSQPEQMRYVLDHSDCKLVLAAPEWAERVQAVLDSLPRRVSLRVLAPDGDGAALRAALPADQAPQAWPAPQPAATALLMYTSGTTGVPKGVMLTQANLVANALAISTEHALGPNDRVLAVLPLYHINAFAVTMLAPLAHGGSLAMPPRFSSAQFWAEATGLHCTWINVVPTMISYLLEGAAPPRDALQGIRFCRSASSALPPEHHRAFEAKFGIGIIETMGLTETVAPSFSNPLEPAARKLGSVGLASGGEARVVDAALQPVPDGTTGEILIRGPHVMSGYYKNEAATAAAFTPDGWLRTGDLGHRDADGFYFVTGRIKELIIKGGENIAPREIDEAVGLHPAVLDAAAVGIPDRHYGQEIMVCVVLRDGAACTEEMLRAHCMATLGRYKTPKVIRFVTALPRGPSGKVQRLKLLDVSA